MLAVVGLAGSLRGLELRLGLTADETPRRDGARREEEHPAGRYLRGSLAALEPSPIAECGFNFAPQTPARLVSVPRHARPLLALTHSEEFRAYYTVEIGARPELVGSSPNLTWPVDVDGDGRQDYLFVRAGKVLWAAGR